ncbi:hypothetical protein HDV00_008845 [Rhizophlyctis rosea]|nr:hypothetical protein HDV00_008845 [Rhizophlyctis rosea]
MSYSTRQRLCATFFVLKATFALLLASAALAAMSWRIYNLHKIGLALKEFNEWRGSSISIDPTSPSCSSTNTGRAKLEPVHGMMIGYSLDWQKDVPLGIASRMGGLRGAISNAFLQVDATKTPPYNTGMLDWHAQTVQQMGGILEVTFEVIDLTKMTDAIYDMIAKQLYQVNSQRGVPVLLRWCHEMNGDWTSYGYKPALYKPSFVKMTTYVRQYTNMTVLLNPPTPHTPTAMVWSPNIGIAYPFATTSLSQSPPPTAASDPTNFALLKTSTHSLTQIDSYDDPYLPYYPGDAYVDWVSLSVYYYPDQLNWANPATWTNTAPEMDFFASQLLGYGPWVDRVLGDDSTVQTRAIRAFYDRFSAQKNKPMMLAESGAPLIVGRPGASELDIKRAWWQQTVNSTIFSLFPNLKAIVNFEERKDNGDGSIRDWAYTFNQTVADAYTAYLDGVRKAGGKIWFAEDLVFGCDGSVGVPDKA